MLSDPALNLAVTGPNPVQLLLYGGVLILIVMLMGVALLFIRHKFRSRQENSSPAGLTVEQLARALGLPAQTVRRHVEDGAPAGADGTINLIHYAAWLNKRLGERDGD